MEFTFEQLPNAVNQLYDKLANIEKLLLQKANAPQNEADELLTVQDAAKFLSLSVPTIYGLISKKQIPVMKRSNVSIRSVPSLSIPLIGSTLPKIFLCRQQKNSVLSF